MNDWRKLCVTPKTTIKEVIDRLNETAKQIALVVGPEDILLGTITDGDIRRGFLKGHNLDSLAELIMNRHPKIATSGESETSKIKVMSQFHLRHLPVLDSHQRILSVFSSDEISKPSARTNRVVLMAGGMGKRLGKLTENTPKPLISVGGGKPILEVIMENTLKFGLKNISISVNYKADMIEEHFGDGSRWGASINYIRERERLGTAGALGLITEIPEEPIIVMNGDVLTKVNLDQLLDFHREQKASLTMGVREYDIQVPFGVVTIKDHHVTAIEEKPINKYYVNAGIYVLEPSTLRLIPKNQSSDMPELIEKLIASSHAVAAFPLREYWIDVGQKIDFEKAQSEFVGEFS